MRSKWRRILSFLVLMGVLVACDGKQSNQTLLQTTAESTFAPSPTITSANTRTDQIDQHMREKYPSFSGTILVAERNQDLVVLSYGLADREHGVPNTSQTRYEIGSIGKSITAMAIMILEERGLLNVEDPLCEYLPDCPQAWEPVTLHHLLNHTSGIPSFTDLASEGKIEGEACVDYTPDEVIATFRDFPLDFQPGSSWHYNNSGFFLLGLVIEGVTGESYETFIQENILLPLGMSDTGYNHAHKIVKNRASGYSLELLELINAPDWHVSTIYAAGGFYSTVGDLFKWDQALYSEQLVSKETLDRIFASSSATNYGSTKYGYGWYITEASGHKSIEHNGQTSGFLSQLARYPNDQVTIIVLSNFDMLDVNPISRELAALVFENR